MTNTLNDQLGSEALRHKAGPLLAPLFTWRGQAVYPVFGAEGDEDAGDGGGSADEDTDTDGTAGEGGEADSDKVSKADFDKIMARMKAADKRASELEAFKKKAEEQGKSELDKATARVTELEKVAEKQSAELAKARLDNAFLSADTGITWHDPGDALALAERKGYLDGVVGEDGSVDNKRLATKLKEMAKASPHLVKQGKEDADSSGGAGTAPTGQKVGSKGGAGGKDKGPDLSRYSRILNR